MCYSFVFNNLSNEQQDINFKICHTLERFQSFQRAVVSALHHVRSVSHMLKSLWYGTVISQSTLPWLIKNQSDTLYFISHLSAVKQCRTVTFRVRISVSD